MAYKSMAVVAKDITVIHKIWICLFISKSNEGIKVEGGVSEQTGRGMRGKERSASRSPQWKTSRVMLADEINGNKNTHVTSKLLRFHLLYLALKNSSAPDPKLLHAYEVVNN